MSALPSRSPALSIRPVGRDVGRAFVARHLSHHRVQLGQQILLEAFVAGELVAVVVLGSPHAPPLEDGETWELTHLCCGSRAPRFVANRLLGCAPRVALSAGVSLLVRCTRIDEPGSCFAAANWWPVATTKGRPQDTGNRAARWLRGLEDAVRTTDVIDRVRGEIGPRAGEPGAHWVGERGARLRREAA